MIIANALASVKARLDIPTATTDFDASITIFINDSVKRLYPYASVEVEAQTKAITPVNGEAVIDLSTLSPAIVGFRQLEYTETGSSWHPVEDKSAHGKLLTIRDLPSNASEIKLYGLNPFALADLPEYLELGVIYYACAEFYNYLIGNKRKYNVYMQAAGGRSVDNMQDMSEFYEQKADAYIADRATVYGY